MQMKSVLLDGKQVVLDPSKSIGRGGEAEVFDIGYNRALKIFKGPDHPDFLGQPNEDELREAARRRIAEHQKKLPAFPSGLPSRVITPKKLAMDKKGRIVGYSMEFIKGAEVLLRYTDSSFRGTGIDSNDVVRLFMDLHETVKVVHDSGVVIGDFNDLNVLVNGTEVYCIDADSMQFGRFMCMLYTEKFVDPLLCDPKGKRPELVKPYVPDADWYAFCVMFMRCMLYTSPYDGIYRPKDPKKRIPHDARPLRRITVFNPEVRYPKPALPREVLPDEILHHFHLVFEKDQRGEFPISLLEGCRWTKCTNCGTEHARVLCPECAGPAPAAVKTVVQVRGNVTSRRVFQTKHGVILHASYQNGKLCWLWHDGTKFVREQNGTVAEGGLRPSMRFRLLGSRTFIADNGLVLDFEGSHLKERFPVDSFGNLAMLDTNSNNIYWVSDGRLMKQGMFGEGDSIGNVLKNQTLFWVGEKFGFGFYIAGTFNVAFVFDTKTKGINDSVKLPRIAGQLVDSTCAISDKFCWFFMTVNERSRMVNRCYIIDKSGTVVAEATAQQGDGSWLSEIRGGYAVGGALLVPTDEGVVKVEHEHGRVNETKRFPDTEPFVSSGSHLFAGDGGLYVVSKRSVAHLTIA
jgi:H/ACA ribonucleoprotein complex subunit 3